MAQADSDRKALEEAHRLVVSGECERAVPILEDLHRRGVADGTGMLGLLHCYGQGLPMNAPLGEQLLLRAALAGVGSAAHNLGSLYIGGAPGVPRNPEKAMQFYRLARSLGCQTAPDSFYE